MPDNATNVSVLRIVVREGLSADLARALHDDARTALASPGQAQAGRALRRSALRALSRSRTRHAAGPVSGTMARRGRATPISLTSGRPRRGRGGPGRDRAQRAGAARARRPRAGDGCRQGRRLRPRGHPGRPRRAGRRRRRTRVSPPSTRHWRCAPTASPHRCWPGCTRPGIDFAPALLADVQIAVSSVRQLDELLDAVRRTGRTATVTVKVDTGLNRNGVAPARYPGDADRAAPGRRRRRHPAARADVAPGLRRPARQSRSMTFRPNGSARCWRRRATRGCGSRWRTCRIRRPR